MNFTQEIKKIKKNDPNIVEYMMDEYNTHNEIIEFSKSLDNNKYLTSIEFLMTEFNYYTMTIFSEMISQNTTIKCLSFYFCEICDLQLEILLKSLQKNNTLEFFYILDDDDKKFSEENLKLLANYIENNTSLKMFTFPNHISEAGFYEIANALKINNTLETLSFNDDRNLGYEKRIYYPQSENVKQYFQEALQQNITLRNLYGIDVGDLLNEDVIKSRQQCRKIKKCI